MYDGSSQHALYADKFTGKERDSESGLDDFGARYYTSSMGRFMTPDWAAGPNPVPYASFGDPQTLNLYGYVRNNPLRSTDPTGHCTVDGEKHGWVWCAKHSLGFAETKKETGARLAEEKRKREEYFKITGRSLDADIASQLLLSYGLAMGAVGGAIEPEPAPVLQGANYAQTTYSQAFSEEGALAGETVESVAAKLRSGAMKPSEIPLQYIVRDGNKLILNTRIGSSA